MLHARVGASLSLFLTPTINTPYSTSATEDTMTQKVIEAAGCRFVEYRGEGKPVEGNPPANLGDVYFDVKEQPYTAWVCQPNSGWKQWTSMAESKNCKHPEQDRILSPSVQRLAWVPISGYDGYLRQTKLRLGKRNDAADTHIKIILDHERGVKPPPPPQIEAPSLNRAPSPNSSTDDDEVERLPGSAIIGSDPVQNVTHKAEAELSMEAHADLKNRCSIMRSQNDNIQKAIATASGTCYVYDLQWSEPHRCNRA